jgi:hypothetical protein
MKQKRNPILGYTRLIAKVTGLVATLTAIFIFMLQYLPTYLKIGRGMVNWFYYSVYIVGMGYSVEHT